VNSLLQNFTSNSICSVLFYKWVLAQIGNWSSSLISSHLCSPWHSSSSLSLVQEIVATDIPFPSVTKKGQIAVVSGVWVLIRRLGQKCKWANTQHPFEHPEIMLIMSCKWIWMRLLRNEVIYVSSLGKFILPVFAEWLTDNNYHSLKNCGKLHKTVQGSCSFVIRSISELLNNFNWVLTLCYWIF
jgi:hypothetical protein